MQKPVAPNLSGWQIRTQHPLRILILAVLSISLCAIEPAVAHSSPPPQKSSQTKKQKPSNPKQVRTTVNRPKSKKVAPDRPSFANAMGLRNQPDDLSLKSSVAMVIDQQTKEVLFEKNPDVSLPIASITKLMTAMVVLDSNAPLDEVLTITQAEVKIYAKSRLSLVRNAQTLLSKTLLGDKALDIDYKQIMSVQTSSVIQHIFSHRRLQMYPYLVSLNKKWRLNHPSLMWIKRKDLAEIGLPQPIRMFLESSSR